MTSRVLGALATIAPVTPTPDDDFRRSLAFLDLDATPTTVLEASYGAAVVAGVLGLPAVLVTPARYRPAAVTAVAALALGAAVVVRRLPAWLAAVRRTEALGAAPDLIGRTVLRMRVTPTVESAAGFAARTGGGPLAASLARHVRAASGTPRAGLVTFAERWAEPFPALERAAHLVEAAAAAPPGERERTLERAVETVLDGARDEMADFAASIRGPATALYAFGVLLPLSLVAVLPAARAAGIGVPTVALVAIYDLLLPGVLLGAAAWLLSRRPVAFPPPDVSRSHPDVPDRRLLAPVVGGLAAVTALVAPAVRPLWARPILAVGLGTGVALLAYYRPVVAVRGRVRAVEEGLPDALYLVGRRVREGTAVEEAVERAGEEVPGATGETFTEAARRGRQLRVGVEEAFLGDHGPLRDIPSERARGAAALLAAAAHEGRPAGRAVVATAEHVATLREVETEARRDLRQVTGTLGTTGAFFGPLVGGATVAMADGMATTAVGGEPMATATLGIAVGAYVLALAALLPALAVALEYGLDRSLIGYRVGIAVPTAAVVYVLAVVAAAAIV